VNEKKQASNRSVLLVLSIVIVLAAFAVIFIDDRLMSRATVLCIITLALWLTELIPLYATSLFLLFSIPLFLGSLNHEFAVARVILWPANPVLALFFGGFALSVAGKKYGIDAYIARLMLRVSRSSRTRLVVAIMIGTAVLSMWMSNIAASAMMIMVLRPLWKDTESDGGFRTAILLALAFGANFGGMATPIGTGPNAIAIAAVQEKHGVTFLNWMIFALPLTVGLLLLTFLILKTIYPIRGQMKLPPISSQPITGRFVAVVVLFTLAVSFWLLEPLHGISAATVALGVAVLLFGSGLLSRVDLAQIDWATLLLIAGGLTLGEMIDRSGLAKSVASSVDWHSIPRGIILFSLIFSAAFLSAIASNTAAAILLIRLGTSMDPSPYLPILIAIGASLGAPFVISTPPNAMVYGEGGISAKDFLIPGIILMIVGCLIVSLTGLRVLALAGLN
jgi:solute carrier family 13 (sodium-dependent dicarboxylate transporter), member 2/3/5